MGKSATQDILEYMRNNRKIGVTNNSAKEMFGVTRLSGIIFDLRKRGYDIETQMETCKTRYGKTTDYARYILKEDK